MLGNLSARDFIAKGLEDTAKSRGEGEAALATLGNMSARDYVTRGLETAAQSSPDLDVDLGQLSARAAIAVGLEQCLPAIQMQQQQQQTQGEVQLGQYSAREFIGLGVEKSAHVGRGGHGGSTAGATKRSSAPNDGTDEFAQLTARSAIAAGLTGLASVKADPKVADSGLDELSQLTARSAIGAALNSW